MLFSKRSQRFSLSLALGLGLVSAMSCKTTSNFSSQPATGRLKQPTATTETPNTSTQTSSTVVASPSADGTMIGSDGKLDAALPGSDIVLDPLPGELSETFVQKAVQGATDILIVVDDSSSMSEEQKNLASKLSSLLSSLQGFDWQIGIISTSVKEGASGDECVLDLIKSSESGIETRFAAAVNKGTSGDDNEQGIRQAVNGLRCTQKPWIRSKSTVAVLILSDEDNCSDGKGCSSDTPGYDKQYLIDYVEKDLKRVVGVNAGFYGIFSPPHLVCKTARKANIYQALIDYKNVGQINYGNICDTSYHEALERISKNIAKLLTSTFKLKMTPAQGSVRIVGKKSNGEAITASDYQMNADAITFTTGKEPAVDSQVVVYYKAP